MKLVTALTALLVFGVGASAAFADPAQTPSPTPSPETVQQGEKKANPDKKDESQTPAQPSAPSQPGK